MNGGFIPILETPNGDLIHDEKTIMEFAHEVGGSNGLELYSKDPVKAA